ncbi:hypothetical protein [Cellulomonas edaphi]|uniref:Ribosomally synthesized peptide with SipW-like signal peptide n=1 Tax=Cellulomonas edaphi TaxID=3053468 RepID=A0ABT7S4G4_9CELL|nr:hypothetical protein [Cellulomons edaphi]MDM7830495.1 hypothetical protein [Cellulomons edaphi]
MRRRIPRRRMVQLVLAAFALFGIGAAATSALWTNSAYFQASASGASVDLQASTNGTTWLDADTADAGVAVDLSSSLADLRPNTTRGPLTVYLKNSGSVPLTVAAVAPVKTGDLFTAPCALTVTTTALGATTLAVGATTTMTVTVTVPNLPLTCQNKTGSLVLQFTGTTS